MTIRAHGGVFHTAGVDAGTSLLLDYLDAIAADVHSDAVDLGCGNGVISAHLARLLPQATIHATDVSWQAIDSTHLTAQANQLDIVTHWCDGLVDIPNESVDVVVTNPPFHRGTARITPRPWPCWLTPHACYAPAGLCGVYTTTTCRGRLMSSALLGRPTKSCGIVDTPSSEQCVDKPKALKPAPRQRP
ncbi:23S rRNA (guanine-N-2-) -methyltransferase RmG [Cutibacterium acnes JCM 18916]|nr:23S rRNA (guanine-N-2-) -methyltransferase RmG [Cutibacterium acnes JCM 18916]